MYTQDDRQRDSIVDDLTSAFDLADIELVKDTENVVIGSGNITKFEREIGDAQYVIVVLCDKYFLSPHCMYEWDMIHQNTDNKLICYVYFADEKIIYADGELDGRSMPIKDKYADYYPLIRKTWQNWHKNLVEQHRKEIFALSDVETYACNKNLDDIHNVNEDNPYLYSQSFTVISSILKNSSVVRGTQTTNFKNNAATIIAKEFKKSFEDNIKKSFGLNIDESNKITKEFELHLNVGRDINVDNSTQTNIGIQIINNYNGVNLPSSNGSNNIVSPSVKTVHTFLGDFNIDYSLFAYNANFPHRRSSNKFVCYGRETECLKLRERFKSEYLVSMVAVGGTGKTYFAHKFKSLYGKTDYEHTHHVYLGKDIMYEFITAMSKLICNPDFTSGVMLSDKISTEDKIKIVVMVLENVDKKVLLVLDVNVTERAQFKTKFLDFLLPLEKSGKWNILVLSRKKFTNVDIPEPMELEGFKNEPLVAINMFRAISGLKDTSVCSDEKLLDIFGMEGFNYNPLLISALASYCKNHENSFSDIKKTLQEAYSRKVDKDMDLAGKEETVVKYLRGLISFDSYKEMEDSQQFELLLRHFILWQYDYVQKVSIEKFLKGYGFDSYGRCLEDLVDDMILTESQSVYRINGYTPKEAMSVYRFPSEDAVVRQAVEEGILKKDEGYRMHDMLADSLRMQKTEFDYSIYLNYLKMMFVFPKDMRVFAELRSSIFDSLYIEKKNKILKPSEELYLLALPQYYYFAKEQRATIIQYADKAIDKIEIDYDNSFEELDNLVSAIHDSVWILNNVGEEDKAVKFCKIAIEFRKKLKLESQYEQKTNTQKLAVEYCTYCVLLKQKLKPSREANLQFGYAFDLLRQYEDMPSKALLFQFLSVYHNLFGNSFNQKQEDELFKELSKDINSRYSPIPKMVRIERGKFDIGCEDDDAFDDEKPVHTVKIEEFEISIYPVTQLQWDYINSDDIPSFLRVDYHRGLGPDYPMYSISWNEVQGYIDKLNASSHDYTHVYSLPKEVQWEYAAKGGHKTTDEEKKKIKYSGTMDGNIGKVAWYYENSEASTHPVGEMEANELGLYDMSGNVWEWCQDSYDSSFYKKCKDDANLQTDPCNEGDSGSARVLRGGSWSSDARYCRVSYRGNPPDSRFTGIGFRLSLSSQKKKK
ncbi:MAG: SUMF1/EgtB/PvdO family nonheme iron enzyme [Bacteroidales bacterium]|nr:SUMF1/EgtB/PvdO family nonheme iron enzyme [Bacteroidales bacterium]